MYDTAELAYVDKAEETPNPRQGLKRRRGSRYVDGRRGSRGLLWAAINDPHEREEEGVTRDGIGHSREEEKKAIYFLTLFTSARKSHTSFLYFECSSFDVRFHAQCAVRTVVV